MMTNETLTVEQRHRDAASKSVIESHGHSTSEDKLIEAGSFDDHPRVIEFAQFERDFLTQEGRGDVIEQCATIADIYASERLHSLHETAGRNIAADIRALATQSPDLPAGDGELKPSATSYEKAVIALGWRWSNAHGGYVHDEHLEDGQHPSELNAEDACFLFGVETPEQAELVIKKGAPSWTK